MVVVENVRNIVAQCWEGDILQDVVDVGEVIHQMTEYFLSRKFEGGAVEKPARCASDQGEMSVLH